MMRQTVKEIRYSDIFKAVVRAEYAGSTGLLLALDNNSYMLGRWLDDCRYFTMTPEQIVAAFASGTPNKVLQAAETAVRRTNLYSAWDLEVFTEDQSGSKR